MNSVHPDLMPAMGTSIYSDRKRRADWVAEHVTMGHQDRREEVALGVLFLASDEASYITGTELVIDRGLVAM